MMPAPTITTSAVSATPPPYGKREPGSTRSRLNRRGKTAIMARAPRDDPSGGREDSTDAYDRSGMGHRGGAVPRVRGAHAIPGRRRRGVARADPPAQSGVALVYRGL